jgi:hypothetical protein
LDVFDGLFGVPRGSLRRGDQWCFHRVLEELLTSFWGILGVGVPPCSGLWVA